MTLILGSLVSRSLWHMVWIIRMNFNVWPTVPPSLKRATIHEMTWIDWMNLMYLIILCIATNPRTHPDETEGVVTWHHAVLASVNPPEGRSQYQHHNRVRDPMCAMSQRQVEGAPTDTNQKGWSRSWKWGLVRTLKKRQMSNISVFKVFYGGFRTVISEFGVKKTLNLFLALVTVVTV